MPQKAAVRKSTVHPASPGKIGAPGGRQLPPMKGHKPSKKRK
jgi:hypothetical protein